MKKITKDFEYRIKLRKKNKKNAEECRDVEKKEEKRKKKKVYPAVWGEKRKTKEVKKWTSPKWQTFKIQF
jgi:hypothetical protein